VLYYPHAQDPHNEMQIVVRSASGTGAIAGAVRDAIHRIDPDLPVAQLRPYTALLGDALSDSELALSLLGAFAMMALALAAAGIYGVMAFVVAERRVEFGIRLALGASAGDLVRLVCSHGLRLTIAGVALGLIGARLTSTLLHDMVVGVGATDPAVFAGTAALLALIAMAASLVPALRAMHLDPIDALKPR
jgi:putative ABC transport system permease protein